MPFLECWLSDVTVTSRSPEFGISRVASPLIPDSVTTSSTVCLGFGSGDHRGNDQEKSCWIGIWLPFDLSILT